MNVERIWHDAVLLQAHLMRLQVLVQHLHRLWPGPPVAMPGALPAPSPEVTWAAGEQASDWLIAYS